jgi:hypothetical protein
MKVFTDDEMNALLPRVQPYSVAILKKGRTSPTTDRTRRSGSTLDATSGCATMVCSPSCCQWPTTPMSAVSACSTVRPDMPEGVTGIRVSGRLRGDDLREFKPAMEELLKPARSESSRSWRQITRASGPAA